MHYIFVKKDRDARIDIRLEESPPPTPKTPHLHATSQGLYVIHPELRRPFLLSFDGGALDHRARRGGEMLFRATGASKRVGLTIVDATAGLCREAFLMASAGANVYALEKNLALYSLAHDAITRSQSPVISRLHLHYGDALHLVPSLAPDVVYLDPMFPESTKTAAVGKEAVILRAFARHTEPLEERRLLECALEHAYYRVVVKRPLKAPPLTGPKPTASLKGKAIRYDLYGKRKLPTQGQKVRSKVSP